ncbi:hypothetical protein [cyanobacterium endosymbiont of Epithemia clementina EcSB]|uniref:hypothetical protein n=1 Tax=cyanobacterium endosymbiont of Epithemia clementina EcSB TaxID=3034674 RepID=UPI002480E0AA|nr:hypothetical protein [cyanobacterium endosymbiont of Epithemia clementina EcSB]WGT66841.1 hypothetical protein P3F56_06185 [cyanobacterium endosymbiont of Epithemia clementina EcSB]
MVNRAIENLIIVSSGPAGYTTLIYAGRAKLRPILFECLKVGGSRDRQLMTTTKVEKFTGFSESITFPELMEQMRAKQNV